MFIKQTSNSCQDTARLSTRPRHKKNYSSATGASRVCSQELIKGFGISLGAQLMHPAVPALQADGHILGIPAWMGLCWPLRSAASSALHIGDGALWVSHTPGLTFPGYAAGTG